MITRYRKKPIVVEAIQWDGSETLGRSLEDWSEGNIEYHPFLADRFRGDPNVYIAHPDPFLRIKTLEGTMIAKPGDWIIKGVKGEFYPCKPEIFAETYEEAHRHGRENG